MSNEFRTEFCKRNSNKFANKYVYLLINAYKVSNLQKRYKTVKC